MNDIESMFIIFGILSIFICVPTFFLCNCNKGKAISRKEYEELINEINNKKNYKEITDDKSDIIQV